MKAQPIWYKEYPEEERKMNIGETKQIDRKYLQSISGVTSMKDAFIIALFNSNVVIGQNRDNEKMVIYAIDKIRAEEKEKQRINKLLNKCFMYDSLRNSSKYIQKVIDKEEIIIFRFNKNWWIKLADKTIKRNELFAYRAIDKKAIRINKNNLCNFKLETIIEGIKAYRDIVICEKEINDYQEYFDRIDYLGGND